MPKLNPAVRRRLAGVPVVTANDRNWETRKTESAAIECALVAAGMCGSRVSTARTSGMLPVASSW